MDLFRDQKKKKKKQRCQGAVESDRRDSQLI